MGHWTEEAFLENPGVFQPELEEQTEAAEEEVSDLLELLADGHDLDPATVLDVPCGIGRHALPMAERGLAVTGVDIAPDYLARARERADEAGVDVTFREGDMRDLQVAGPFDLVANLWTSFGYYDADTDRAILADLCERVAEDGALVVELSNKDGVMAAFDEDGVVRREDHVVVETREYDPRRSRIATERELFTADGDGYEHAGTVEFDTRVFSPDTLRRWLLDAGFGEVSLYADHEGSELTRESVRLLAVAEP